LKSNLSIKERDIVAVDLDGTLIKSDILYDSLILFVKNNFFQSYMLFIWLFKGKAYLKTKLAKNICPIIEFLPYNEQLLVKLRKMKAQGAYLVLATATHHTIAEKIAAHLAIFDEVVATSGDVNMAAENKRDCLNKKFGSKQYSYFGNSSDDYAVWDNSKDVHIVNAAAKVLTKSLSLYDVKTVVEREMSFVKTFIKAIRVHQWMKNALIFVPLLASHQITDPAMLINGVIAFVAFSFCASSVYLLNDMLDIEDDRQHKTKKFRPIPAGNFSLIHAILLCPILLGASVLISYFFLPIEFLLILTVYYFLTVTYSFGLKKVVMLDVVLLSLLYTTRVIAGTAAMSLEPTFWILAFSLFIFLSLAFVKRYTELFEKKQLNYSEKTPGRGYYPADFELLSSLGSAAGYISVLVLALYINDFNHELYSTPEILWLACPLLMFWLSRVWLIAHRGEMHDDPVVFAVKDRTSQVIGVLFLTTFACASWI
jgi:4-hydroxybenzoate polyprenyltransferase/phosphoserine phosphatase